MTAAGREVGRSAAGVDGRKQVSTGDASGIVVDAVGTTAGGVGMNEDADGMEGGPGLR